MTKRSFFGKTACFIFMAASLLRPAVAADKDVVQTAMDRDDLSTFVMAMRIADLEPLLRGQGPFTIFAPNNDAFQKLPKGQLDSLIADRERLSQVLLYHVVQGKLMSRKAAETGQLPSVEGRALEVMSRDNKFTVSNADVVKTDVEAANGVIHIIDTVLIPPVKQGQ